MRNLLLIACIALPLSACAGAVDENESGNGTTAEQKDDLTIILPDGLLDFDEVNGTPIPNNSIVDTTYSASNHVTFAVPNGHAYARLISSGNQGVSPITVAFFDERDGTVTATFDTPRTWVSIDAAAVLPFEYKPPVTNRPWLRAYDANGNLVGEKFYPIAYGQPGYGTMQTLTVTTAPWAQIASVRFSSEHISGAPVYGEFDNLRYDGGFIYIPPPPPPIPPLHPTLQ